VRRTVELTLVSDGQRSVQRRGSVLDKCAVQLLDLARPGEAMAMHDLGEERLRRRAEIEDLLALEIEPPAFAGDPRQPRGAILGMDAVLTLLGDAGVFPFEPPGHDPN